jgi:small subunit ribosomal protein S17
VLRIQKKYKVHDAENTCRVGDLVSIVESRPLSREKRWRVEEIVKRVGTEIVAQAPPELAEAGQ